MPELLSAVLVDYGAGLDIALQLLTQLEDLAARQAALPASAEPAHLQTIVVERQRLLDGLLALETRLRPLRERIATHVDEARLIAGFEVIAARHRTAAAAVTRILRVDKQSLDTLQQADVQRRADAQVVETAGATLAAYRRVLSGPQGSAGLVDQRG